MKISDVVFNVPITGGKDKNVMVLVEAQGYDKRDFAQTMFEEHLRLRHETGKPTTSLAIFTGRVTPAESSYTESIEGSKLTLEYNTFNLPDHEVGELRKDKRPFAQIVLAARMAMDAGDNDVELHEKCAMNILEVTKARDYTPKSRDYILDFSKDIFWLDDDRISEKVREAYKMPVEYVSLETRAQELKMQQGFERGLEQGMERGLEQGMERGMERGMIKAALNLLQKGFSDAAESLAQGIGLKLEDLSKLAGEKFNAAGEQGRLGQSAPSASDDAIVKAAKAILGRSAIITKAEKGKTYTGEIVKVDQTYAVQKIGVERGIKHRLSETDAPELLREGAKGISIAYDKRGKGSVKTEPREAGRDSDLSR
jgi:hypothetical protein